MPITMKDLCLLHERDGKRNSADNGEPVEIMDILQLPSLSWTNLRALLTAPVKVELWASMANRGQITREQVEYAMDARKLIHRLDRKAADGLYDDVYHAVWAIESSSLRYQFYRGHRDSRWTLQTTLFRPEQKERLPDNHTLLWRVSQTSAFLRDLRAQQDVYLGGSTDDDSLLAIAQHFGMPTHLLDFSRSPRVAAFFATQGQEVAATGAIYCLRVDEQDVVFDFGGGANRGGRTSVGKQERTGLGQFGRELDLNMEELTGIHFGDLRVIEPRLPPNEDRIARQLGVFIENSDPQHLNDAKIKIFRFKQRDGVVFEDKTAGIDQSTLLPDDTGLDRLAKSVRESLPKTAFAIDPLLAPLVMSRPTIIGSKGAYLTGQVRNGEAFFEELNAFTNVHDAGWKPQIGAILKAHFERCQAHAMRSEVIGEDQDKFEYALFLSDALKYSVKRLAEWANVPPALLTCSLLADLDWALSLSANTPNPDPKWKLVAREPRQRIALACATYLVAWDHLRFVAGLRAAALARKASLVLVDDGEQ